MWRFYNPNPRQKNTGDCVVRSLSKALDTTWEHAKLLLDAYSMDEAEVETSDVVWCRILAEHGFIMERVQFIGQCTLNSFCEKHRNGTYVVKLPNHVVCVKDGCFYDSWDSGNEAPIYYWRMKIENM